MDNLDDLMRQKFDSDDPGARFEFREEYWEQAQALLEQDEARRRRRLWLFIGLVLALALLAWFLMARWGAEGLSQNKGGEQDLLGRNEPRHETSLERPLSENLAQSNEIKSSDSGKTGHSSEESVLDNAKAKSSEGQASVKEKSLQNTVAKNDARESGKAGNTPGKHTQHGENTGKSMASKDPSDLGAAQQSQYDEKNKHSSGGVGNALGKSTQSNGQSQLILNAQSPATNNQSPITNIQSPVTNNQSPITKGQSPITNIQPPITNNQSPITYPNIPISILPIPVMLLKWSERVLVAPKLISVPKQPIAEQTKPVQDQRFSFGLSLAGAAYQQTDTASSWAGWAIGAFGKYRLNKNWALMLGAQGRFVPGQGTVSDSSNPSEVSQLRYSFGFKRETWKRETRGLYNLEMPLSVQWNKGPWGLEVGGAAGTLWFVQDRTEHTVESSLEAAKTETKKWVKGDAAPYNRSYFSAFTGAEYQINARLSVMARGQYRFTPAFKTASEGVKSKGLGNVDFGLRYRLF